jgi:hypothetical protein
MAAPVRTQTGVGIAGTLLTSAPLEDDDPVWPGGGAPSAVKSLCCCTKVFGSALGWPVNALCIMAGASRMSDRV